MRLRVSRGWILSGILRGKTFTIAVVPRCFYSGYTDVSFYRLEFPSLRSVNKTVSICNVLDCDMDYHVARTTMDISLPVLESAGDLHVKGTASR
jgi:hypothetical protein